MPDHTHNQIGGIITNMRRQSKRITALENYVGRAEIQPQATSVAVFSFLLTIVIGHLFFR